MRRRAPLALVLLVLGLAGPASSQPAVDLDEAARAIQQATRDYNDGQLARAIEALTPVIDQMAPARSAPAVLDVYVRALFLRGRAHLLRSDLEAMQADFRAVLLAKGDFTPDPGVAPKILQAFTEVREATIGRIVLTVSPGDARVELDGRPVEHLGSLMSVITGPHTLSVSQPGYRPHTESLVVEPRVPLERAVTLERVAAVARMVTSPPDVEVIVNGTPRGRTTAGPPGDAWRRKLPPGRAATEFSAEFVLPDVAVGTLDVAFRKPCYVSVDERWTVANLADYTLDPVVLDKAVGTVRIDAPAGASVSVDEEPRGQVPLTLEVCAGEHRIDVRASGGRDIQVVPMAVGQSLTIVPRLRPVVAILNVVRPQGDRGAGPVGADAGPDRRVEMERRLVVERALFWAPPLAQATAARGAAVQDGWLSYSLDREPDSDVAHSYSSGHLRELSAKLADELGVQAVAEMRLRSTLNRNQNDFLLSILARGSTVPDVIDIDLGSGPSVSRAVAALNALPEFYRPSLGVVFADALDVPGPVIARVLAGSSAAAAGLAAGDVVTRLEGQAVADAAAVGRLLATRGEGDVLTVEYRDRQGSAKSARLTVSRVPCVIAMNDESWLPNVLVATLRSHLMSRPDPVVRLNLAVALMRLQNWDAALEELAKVDLPSADGVSTGTVQFLAGECYAQLGVVAKARDAWQAAAATNHLLTQDGPPVRDLVPARLAALDRSAMRPQHDRPGIAVPAVPARAAR